jgi:hypothetical protein
MVISANVVEELYGAGWVRDDVHISDHEGRTVMEELWRKDKSVEIRQSGRTVKVLSGKKISFDVGNRNLVK